MRLRLKFWPRGRLDIAPLFSLMSECVEPKCTLAASHAAAWQCHGKYAEETDRQTDRRTDRRTDAKALHYAFRYRRGQRNNCYSIAARR